MSPPAQNALPSPLRIATRVVAAVVDRARRLAERRDHRAVERVELVGALERDAGERPLETKFDMRAHRAHSRAGFSLRPNGSG